MYKWLAIILAGFLIIVGISGCVYANAMEPIKNAKDIAQKRAKSETDIQTIDEFYLYQGSRTYYVVIGKNNKKENTVAWIPENKKENITVKKLSEGITEQEAVNKLIEDKKPKEILGVRLGMEKKLPVWELSYLDDDSHLNYYYIHFNTGKWWRNIENL